MIARLDRLAGKHLFVPVIVRICQAAGISQHRFYRYGWMGGAIVLISIRPFQLGWILFIINSLAAVFRVASAALTPDAPVEPSPIFRRFALICLIADIAGDAVLRLWDPKNLVFWLTVTAAEYAITIRTIPPREVKERKRKLVPARAGR